MKKVYLLLSCLSLLLCACHKTDPTPVFPSHHAVTGLVKPVRLNPDTTRIYLQDYIINTENIDSVTFSKGIKAISTTDKQGQLLLSCGTETLPYYSIMSLWVAGDRYTVLLERSDKIKHTYTYNPKGNTYSKVALAGDFNNWNPALTPLTLIDGLWQTSLMLDPGMYQYLVVPDNVWMIDKNNPDTVSNNMGGFNSVMKIIPSDTLPTPVLRTGKINGDTLEMVFKNTVTGFYVLWENFLLDEHFFYRTAEGININPPHEAFAMDYSSIRVFAANASGKGNDLLIPLLKGKPVTDPATLSRMHKEAQVLYFLLTDRFYDGDPDNNEPVRDAEVAPLANYMGGDLIGVIKKLNEGYFDSLGISAIWLSPLMQNPLKAYNEYPEPHRKFSGYHGYWPVNSTHIDYRLGSEKCLRELVETAHKKKMNIILDFVANHVHEDNPIIKDHPQWATQLELEDGLNIRKWDEHRLTTWFDRFLPSFDFSQQKVIDTVAAIGLYWLLKYDLDGFRHDATKHIPTEFWRAMTLKLKKEVVMPRKKEILQIGETFGSRELIGSYVGNGLLDGQFDFNLYFDARAVFAQDNEPFSKLANALSQSLKSYGSHNLMGNITGNHDLPRFTSLASGDLRFDENAKEAAWKRKIEITDTIGYTRMAQFMAFNMCIPGIPVVYYGDEIGMAGADDPDNRRMMKFENLNQYQQKLFNTISRLIHLRRSSMALLYGHFEWVIAGDKTIAFIRTYFNEGVLAVFNKDKQAAEITLTLPYYLKGKALKPEFGSAFRRKDNQIALTIPPCGFEIFH